MLTKESRHQRVKAPSKEPRHQEDKVTDKTTHLNVWFVLGPQRLLGRDPAAALTLKTWRVTMSVKVEQRTNINIGKEI